MNSSLLLNLLHHIKRNIVVIDQCSIMLRKILSLLTFYSQYFVRLLGLNLFHH